tara:strand:- start:80 stop:658 length:579 start_codon:yes stop_codon:yes gene_type:complete
MCCNYFKCCKKIPKKRFALPFIGVFVLLILEEVRNFMYLPIVFSFGSFIIFWNFPFLVYESASRPLYYEDIFIDEKKLPNYEISDELKNKFKSILLWVLVITNSLLVGALSDYWLFKSTEVNKSNYIEIIGMTGGIIKIFQIVNNGVAKIMLKIVKDKIKRENALVQVKENQIIKGIIGLKTIESRERINSI